MTAKELLQFQIDEAGYMLDKVLVGWPNEAINVKPTPTSVSPLEQVIHLSECYIACVASASGAEFKWGSFQPTDLSWEALLSDFRDLRAKAIATLEDADEKSIHRLNDYVIAHDQYHIGQLCALRIACDSQWNPYSIYRES